LVDFVLLEVTFLVVLCIIKSIFEFGEYWIQANSSSIEVEKEKAVNQLYYQH